MKNKNVSIYDQTTAKMIDLINQIRTASLENELSSIRADGRKAAEAMQEGRSNIQNIMESNRGGATGMHGFNAENAQVCIANGNALVRGENALYKLLDDNSAVDCLRAETKIQIKACQSHGKLGLDFVKQHAEKYPLFVEQGGIYMIPQDFFEKYDFFRSLSAAEAGKMDNPSYHLWQYIQNFTQENPDIKIEPLVVGYKDVQANQIYETLDRAEYEQQKVTQERIEKCVSEYQPTFKEGVYVTFSSAAFECLIDGVILIFEKNSEGTKIWKFNKTDWQDLGKECAKGFVIGGIRGAAVYTLSNFTIVPASVASVFVTISINLARDAYDLKEGRLNKAQFIQRNESNIIDVSCGAIGAGLGSKYIAGLLPAVMGSNLPAQIAGTIIGNGVGMLVSFFLKKWLIHKKTE